MARAVALRDSVVRSRAAGGPYDVDDLDPDATDATGAIDCGSIRVPVPAHGTVSVDPKGRMQSVHIALPEGRLSVSALAAPRSSTLWPDLCREIADSLRDGGARVRTFTGYWGRELYAVTGRGHVRVRRCRRPAVDGLRRRHRAYELRRCARCRAPPDAPRHRRGAWTLALPRAHRAAAGPARAPPARARPARSARARPVRARPPRRDTGRTRGSPRHRRNQGRHERDGRPDRPLGPAWIRDRLLRRRAHRRVHAGRGRLRPFDGPRPGPGGARADGNRGPRAGRPDGGRRAGSGRRVGDDRVPDGRADSSRQRAPHERARRRAGRQQRGRPARSRHTPRPAGRRADPARSRSDAVARAGDEPGLAARSHRCGTRERPPAE